MQKKRYVRFVCILAAVISILLTIPSQKVQAAPRTGTYQKHFSGSVSDSYRTVVIKKITKKQVIFQILYDRSYPYCSANTTKITGKRNGNTVTFTYKDTGWGEKGKGTMKMYKNYIQIKTTTTGKIGKWPRGAWIGTDGKWFRLKRVSSKKKFV